MRKSHSSFVIRHSSFVIRHSSFVIRMLALILACSISAGGVRAQTTNHEYNFQQRTVTDAETFGNTGDPIPVLSMDCLAANGFGQWTLSHFAGTGSFNGLLGSTEFPFGWYLLANDLKVASVSGFPPGVVQSGQLLNDDGLPITLVDEVPSEPEVTANLDSWVNYIWPDPALGGQFVVNFFEPSDFKDASGNMLSASFCVDPTIGNFGTTGSMRVIPQGSSTTTVIHQTTVSMGGHNIAVISSGPYQDLYDRTSDAHYLYTVWMDNDGGIWATVQVLGASTAEVAPFPVGTGTVPTVACDQRNNRTGTPSPLFDVAFIDPAGVPHDITFSGDTHIQTIRMLTLNFTPTCGGTGASISKVTHARAVVSEIPGGTDVHGLYVIGQPNAVGGPAGEEALFLYTNLPSSGTPQAPTYCDGPLLPITYIPTGPGTLTDNGIIDEPIIAFSDPYDNQNEPNAWDCFHCVYRMNAVYVYGAISNSGIAMLSMKSTHNGGCGDGSESDDTRTPLFVPYPSSTSPNAGYVAAVNQMGIHVHWRSGVTGSGTHFYARDFNRYFDEPIEENTIVTSTCGITDGTSHGGTAGAKLINGKNMLIWTDPNYGADAAIPGGLQFGTYQPGGAMGVFPVVGNIWLSGAVKLYVGDGTNPSMLTVMPNFYIFFLPESQVDGESVTVNPGSTLNYYGLWQVLEAVAGGPGLYRMVFGAAQMTTSPGVRAGEGLIDLEGAENGSTATLIVHGGADFHIGYNGYFTSNYGTIIIENEPSIFPLIAEGSTTTNPFTNGLLTFEGQATLNNTKVQAHTGPFNSGMNAGYTSWNSTTPLPQNSYVYTVIHVPGSYDGGSDGTPFYDVSRTGYARPNGAFTSTNTSYIDYDPGSNTEDPLGLALIQFDQNPTADQIGIFDGGNDHLVWYYPYLHVSSNNDNFLNFSISITDPQETDANPEISITNDNFNLDNYGYNSTIPKSLSQDYVRILKTDPMWNYTDYGYMYLNGNFFYPRSNDANTSSSDLNVIGFETEQPAGNDFDNTDVLAVLDLINIDGNYFYENGGGVYNGTTFGINLNESNSITQFNSIFSSFTNGIAIAGVNQLNNFSYLCTNTIGSAADGGPSVGILTSFYQGYVNSNQIQYATLGLLNTAESNNNPLNSVPHLVGTSIDNCYSYGIEVDGGVVDLSGLHHNGNLSGTGDWFGLNSIFSNCHNTNIPHPAQIYVSNQYSNVWVTQNDYPSTWSVTGYNNIYQGISLSPVLIWAPSHNYDFVDISSNYWGSGIDPQSSSPSMYWPNFYFSAIDPAVSQSTTDWTCGGGGDITAKPEVGMKPLRIQDDTDTCSVKFPTFVSGLTSDGQDREGYDTMRYWYIPHCYSIANAGATSGALDGSAQIGVVMTNVDSLLNFRNFVLHCLTLRKDDAWFCAFVADLIGTYTDSNNIYEPNYRADRAILQYLMDNPRCASGYSGDSTEYWQLLITQYDIWQDTARGKAVFDSTVPTMQELGLDSVLIINGEAGVTYAEPTPQIIMSASVLENPFQNSTSILLSIGREAYVTIQVFDILGHQIEGAGYASVFEQGNVTIPINMTNAPPGTYLVRISTANNETQTLKLTKE